MPKTYMVNGLDVKVRKRTYTVNLKNTVVTGVWVPDTTGGGILIRPEDPRWAELPKKVTKLMKVVG